jgi:hypothetical protein
MKAKIAVLLAILVVGLFLVGCSSGSQSGYSSYNQQGQQNQYVGGGCGVAPQADYSETPAGDFGSKADSA